MMSAACCLDDVVELVKVDMSNVVAALLASRDTGCKLAVEEDVVNGVCSDGDHDEWGARIASEI